MSWGNIEHPSHKTISGTIYYLALYIYIYILLDDYIKPQYTMPHTQLTRWYKIFIHIVYSTDVILNESQKLFKLLPPPFDSNTKDFSVVH